MKKMSPVKKSIITAVCIALCVVLPQAFHAIPNAGSIYCPMHIPVLLCGFLCGPWWGAAVGAVAPLLRHALFHMPPLVTALGMTFELAAYGLVTGLAYRRLPKKPAFICAALLIAMVAGRLVWGMAMVVITGVTGADFGWKVFLSGAVLGSVPGILLQLVLIPALVLALRRAKIMD